MNILDVDPCIVLLALVTLPTLQKMRSRTHHSCQESVESRGENKTKQQKQKMILFPNDNEQKQIVTGMN